MKLLSGCSLLCLLLIRAGTAGPHVRLQCSLTPAGALHPVKAQLERFEAGPGCAAREGGAKETHVIAVGRAGHSADKRVTVVLRPLSYSRPVSRPVILVLSSQHAVHWVLENEGLPENLHVLLQVSANSTVEFAGVSERVHSIPTLPWRPRALLRWTLQRHSTISSLTHSTRANRVYLRLGEDPSMPSVCHLQPLFISYNYMSSEVQEQEANGCTLFGKSFTPEVHVIKLWSAGSGLCGSLQVEVSINLLPPVADVGWYNLVLVLSSAAPVNWALVTQGLRGHITVHSSHTVSPLYPPKPDLTMRSTMVPDLLTTPDLLAWANENNYPFVTSYTEANLANRFVVRLGGGGTVQAIVDAKVEERRLRHWLSQEDDDGSTREAVSILCLDGVLAVSVDKNVLQALSLSVSAVTLWDPSCQAQSNGSHFLLAFPVIFCGTEAEMESRGVQYKNTVLLWKHEPPTDLYNESKRKMPDESAPLVIHFSCVAPRPTPSSAPDTSPSSQTKGAVWPGPDSGPPWVMTPHGTSLISMQLFASEQYEKRGVGPCVITARSRIYAQILGSSSLSGRLQVRSCVVSPLSDPGAHAGWPVIQDFCPADPSFLLHKETGAEEIGGNEKEVEEEESNEDEKEEGDDGDRERNEEDEADEREERGKNPRKTSVLRQGGGRKKLRDEEEEGRREVTDEAQEAKKRYLKHWRHRGSDHMTEKKERALRLRFSFVLRPTFNNSIQFLHCSLQLCRAKTQGPPGATMQKDCAQGPPIPPLVNAHTARQCEYRNVSRPVLVTYSPTEGLAGLLLPPAGQRAQKSGVKETEMSSHSSTSSIGDTVPVLIITFSSFLLGVSLMGALWWIYSCTGKPAVTNRDSLLETMEHNLSSCYQMNQLEHTSSSV